MKQNRPFSIGFPFLICVLQSISTIKTVQSLEQTVPELPPVYYQGVQGKPGVDFPILTAIPKTSFSCRDTETGYYADLETSCQVFHICEDGKKISFLCPNGTIFQQSALICDWWFKVNCTSSPLLYEESSEHLKEEIIKKKSARRLTHKNRSSSTNLKKDIASPNGYSEKNEKYEDKRSKTYSKPNWSSVYNEPQWTTKENNYKILDNVEISTTETSFTGTKNQNNYRRVVVRKKPSEESEQTRKQQENNIPYTPRNKYTTTEANTITVTPENTNRVRTSTPNRGKTRFENVQNPTSLKEVEATTITPNGFYISKKKNQPLTSTGKPKYKTEDTKESKKNYQADIDSEKYVNIFVGARQKVLRANNNRLSNNNKYINKYKTEQRKPSSTSFLTNERNVSPEDSEETQVPQETASIVDHGRFNNYNREKSEKTNQFYENHKSEYSEIKDPKFYNEKYFNSIVPVTSQYITTQSFNTGKIFVGSSVGPIPRNKTANSNIKDHNRITFKLSSIAFNTAQALNPFQQENTVKDPSDYHKQEISTVAFNTAEPFKPNVVSSTEPLQETTKYTTETPIEQYNEAVTKPLNTATFISDFEPSEETKKDSLSISTISLNTAKAYQSLFNEEPKSSSTDSTAVSPEESKTTVSPEEPRTPQTDIPPTLTTTEEPANADPFQIRFNEDSTQEIPTETPLITTSTRAPLPPLKPRPFELLSTQATTFGVEPEKPEKEDNPLYYPFFKISRASPFSLPESSTENHLEATEAPTTEPTNLYIEPEDVEVEESSETFRPGLVVPSSVSPQTLHTLATYFENALNNMTSEERESLDLNDDLDEASMEEKVKILLSHMTRQKYAQLFAQMEANTEEEIETTTALKVDESEDPQKVRKLAKLFSQALSEYLNDPANFKSRLIQVRPTEPPSFTNVVSTEKELLSFSEDDSTNTLASLYNSTWNFQASNKTGINTEENNNFISSDPEGLSIADTQSFVSQFNNLNYEDKKKVNDNLPKNHWTSSPHATNLWRTTFAVDPYLLNKDFLVTESYSEATQAPETEDYSDVASSALSPEEEEVKYELRVFPKVSSNSSKLQGILIDFMNSSTTSESERLHRILRKLNTTEGEFLDRMKKIEENPLTRRLILLLIHECEATKNEKEELIPFLNPERSSEDVSGVDSGTVKREEELVDKDQDARALQLLNSLYNIATKFGR